MAFVIYKPNTITIMINTYQLADTGRKSTFTGIQITRDSHMYRCYGPQCLQGDLDRYRTYDSSLTLISDMLACFVGSRNGSPHTRLASGILHPSCILTMLPTNMRCNLSAHQAARPLSYHAKEEVSCHFSSFLASRRPSVKCRGCS